MDDDEQRDPLARLRAADPAAGLEPRNGFADEVVARTTAPAADAAGAPAVDASAPAVDLASERARRRLRWPLVAAAAAAIVLVGAGGYAVGATTGGTTDLAGGAAPPITMPGSGGSGSLGTAEQGAPMPEPMTVDPRIGVPGTADLSMPYGFGRNRFVASGLSTEAGDAAAYGFDARAASDPGTIAALAEALGVDGDPEQKDGAWTVGPQDGTAPTLWVSLDGTMSFSYNDPRVNPWQCVDGSGGVEPMPDAPDAPMPMQVCEPAGELPTEQAAIDALRSIIGSTGRDAAAFEYDSETWEGAVTRPARAWPMVDGQRIDQAWTLELSDQGIVTVSGALADLMPLGEYPVVSEQEAFERLSDPRFSAQFTTMPMPFAERPASTMEVWTPPTEAPAAPTPGTPISWPVDDVEIVEARLGLASQWQPDGSVIVVPAWEFTDADGGTWSVIAVADEKLDFSTE